MFGLKLLTKLVGVASAGVVALSASAHAADAPEKWLPTPSFDDRFMPLVSGWYIRGDIGYRKTNIGSVSTPMSQPSGTTSLDNALTGLGLAGPGIPSFAPQVLDVMFGTAADPNPAGSPWSIKNGPTFGLGAGYKYKWFRTDVTVDYATPSRIEGGTGIGNRFYSNKIDALTILGNLYLDLGEWGGFTPYIGAGVGASKVALRDVTYDAAMFPITLPGQQPAQWNFSWAAMGGVSYKITQNMLIDVGYRYLSLGDAVHGFKPPLDMVRLDFKNLTAHEVRIGLRYELD